MENGGAVIGRFFEKERKEKTELGFHPGACLKVCVCVCVCVGVCVREADTTGTKYKVRE